MDVVYGIQVTGMTDPYITIAEKVIEMLASAVLPGAFLVDLLPLCACLGDKAIPRLLNLFQVRYVPGWLPGAGFQRFADFTKRLSEKMLDEPMKAIERAMVRKWQVV